MIPHAQFPNDESPWIQHFHDSDEANQRSLIHFASQADGEGHDSFARHLMAAEPGTNPFESYHGPFGEGQKGQQFTPDMPHQMYSEYFGDYRTPGSSSSAAGPFTDPRKIGPTGGAGPVVTGDDYLQRLLQQGGGSLNPTGSQYQ